MKPSRKFRWWFFGVIVSLTALVVAGGTRALWPIVEVYWVAQSLDDANEYVREQAAEQLGDMGPRAALAAWSLSAMLQNEVEKPSVRAAAAYALAQIGVDIPEARIELMKALELGSPSHYRFLGCCGLGRSLDEEVADRIVRLGAKSVPLLVDALSNPSTNVRAWSAEILGRIGSDAAPAVEPLRDVLNDPDVHVRALAEYSLWRITGDEAPVTLAILNLLKESDSNAWRATIAHLDAMGPKAHAVLTTALQDDDVRVRAAAIESIETNYRWDGDRIDAAMAVLAPALQDQDPQIRLLAAMKISQSSMPKIAIPLLIEGLRSDDADLRQNSAALLRRVAAKTKEAVDALVTLCDDADSTVRCEAVRSIGELGLVTESVIPALTRVLSDKTHTIREEAARALGQLGPAAAAALPTLREISLQDKFPAVRQAAGQAIHDITTPVATTEQLTINL